VCGGVLRRRRLRCPRRLGECCLRRGAGLHHGVALQAQQQQSISGDRFRIEGSVACGIAACGLAAQADVGGQGTCDEAFHLRDARREAHGLLVDECCEAASLEERLDQEGCRLELRVSRSKVGAADVVVQGDGLRGQGTCGLQDLERGSVEEGRVDAALGHGALAHRHSALRRVGDAAEAHGALEVHAGLAHGASVGAVELACEPASDLDLACAGFARDLRVHGGLGGLRLELLQGQEELHAVGAEEFRVLGGKQGSRFREGFEAEDAGQVGHAVHAVVADALVTRLVHGEGRGEALVRHDGVDAVEQAEALLVVREDLVGHFLGKVPALLDDLAIGVDGPEGACDDAFPDARQGKFVEEVFDALLRRDRRHTACMHDLQDAPFRGHADFAPGPPRNRGCDEALAAGAFLLHGLGKVLVGGGVVRLPQVAEAARDAAEGHEELQSVVARCRHEGVPALHLDAEDRVELRAVLGGEVLADLDAGCVDDAVDAAPLRPRPLDGFLHGGGVGDVHGRVEHRGAEGLQAGEVAVDVRGLAARLDGLLDGDGGDLLAAGLEVRHDLLFHGLPSGGVELGPLRCLVGHLGATQQ
jgi:hypothetical protein